jgi:hypothetical protein
MLPFYEPRQKNVAHNIESIHKNVAWEGLMLD